VTTTTAASLPQYGLSSTSPFATFVFEEFVFKAHGNTASQSILVDDGVSPMSGSSDYNSVQGKEDLWMQIGPPMVQGVGKVRNTLVTLIQESLSKLGHFILYLMFPRFISPHSFYSQYPRGNCKPC
jgi:hypothetical protein